MPIFVIIIFAGLVLSGSALADIAVQDDAGNTLHLGKPARRVVSLSPGATELLFAAGGGSVVKGVVSYSDYPEAATRLPVVGSYNALDIEKILGLNPDLVVAWGSGNPPMQISRLQTLGLPVFVSEPRNFDDIPKTLLRLGRLLGTREQARRAAEAFRRRLVELKKRYPKNKAREKRVFIQIWNDPPMSINGEHLISKVVEQCNGRNIFHDAQQLTLTLDVETVIKEDPDVIIATRDGALGEKWLQRWRRWKFLNAVRQQALYTVNPSYLVRHTPRILQGMEAVCRLLHSR